MKRITSSYLCLIPILAAISVTAQVRRPRVADDGTTTRASATTAAANPDQAGRRPAIVVLAEPSLSEYLVASEPQALSLHGEKPEVNSAHVRARMFSDEGQSRLASIQANKVPLIAQIQQRGLPVLSQTEHVLNAIMLTATEAELAWLRQQPGVKSAEFSGKKRVNLDAATALVGAPKIWSQVGQDQTGRGMRIAIVDSGIQETGPMFSDTGFSAPSGFPKTNASAGSGYTNNKVIVARNYICPSSAVNSSCPLSSTSPNGSTYDHSAVDGFGHGTFVASVAGGRSSSTPIGTTIAGIAPGAFLGNYKVFDSTGSGDDTAIMQAINDAVADGFNVVNFSGGGSCGQLPSTDTYLPLVKSAVAAGVIVVFPAGNDGPNGELACNLDGDNTISSPGELPDAITAGASTNSHTIAQAIRVLAPTPVPANLTAIAFSAGDTPPLVSTVGPAIAVDVATVDSTKLACNALPAGSMSGKIVVIQRGTCTFATKASNAGNAGAIGAVFYDNVSESLILLTTAGPPVPTVPSGIISLSDGANLVAYLAANPGQVQVRIDATPGAAPQTPDLVSEYSSRGPNPDFAIKPDLVAPGDMYSATQTTNTDPAVIYDPSGFVYAQGTSFATPMTAGSAAVMQQLRPTLTPHDIKSALVNNTTLVTAAQDGATVSVMHTGGGRLNLPAAVATTLVSDPVSISFGQQTSGTVNSSQSVTLKNVGTASETFNVAVAQSVSDPGLTVSTNNSTVTLAVGATTTLTLSMATTTSVGESGIFEGFVNLVSQTTATQIHIPYWVMFGSANASTAGLVDGAGFGKTVGVGSIVSLFGTYMGGAGVGASRVPLPVDVNHTTVVITGRDSTAGTNPQQVPIFYSSADQINFQLPYTLTTGRNQQLQVAVEGVLGNSITFQASAVGPGIFTASGTGVLVHANNSLITPTNPATGGEGVTIYCSGLGAVTPAAQTGSAATGSPLENTSAKPTVTIGGQQATVSFSGLTPGLVGLYQVNVTIPNGLTGAQSVVLSISGATSNSAVTYLH